MAGSEMMLRRPPGASSRRDEKLATLYHRDFLGGPAELLFLAPQHATTGFKAGADAREDQIAGAGTEASERPRSALENLGMADAHIEELGAPECRSAEIMLLGPGDRLRPGAKCLARPAGRARRGALPDRRLERGLDFGRCLRRPRRQYFRPGLMARASVPAESGKGLPRPRQQGPAPIRSHHPHPQGPPGGRQPRLRPPPRHVRGSRGAGDAAARHRRSRGRRGGLRGQEDRLRGQGGRGLRARGRSRPGGATATRSRSSRA